VAADVRVRAYTPTLRAIIAALDAVSIANLFQLGVLLALDASGISDVERAPLPLLVRRTFELSFVPWLLSRVFRALCAGNVTRGAGELAIQARWGALRIPATAILAVRAWRVPLPEPGFAVVFSSGRVGLSWNASRAVSGPPFADAAARERLRALHRPWIKLGLVPAAVTVILFRLHQRIGFGDLMGEALLFGWRKWFHTLTGVALSVFCTLLAVATTLRVIVEAAALVTARLPPRSAARARTVLEATAAVVYYGGIVTLLALRLGL
jgi:hypothetical protein